MNWRVILFSLTVLAFSCGGAPLQAQSTGSQVVREASFELGMDADTSFVYFTPEGERAWVRGWDPRPVFPSGQTVTMAADSVFELVRDEHLVWSILNVDPKQHTAEYIYFVADSKVVRVAVRVEAVDSQHCRVHVRFVATALSDAGRRSIEQQFSREPFAKWIDEWKPRITAAHAAQAK